MLVQQNQHTTQRQQIKILLKNKFIFLDSVLLLIRKRQKDSKLLVLVNIITPNHFYMTFICQLRVTNCKVLFRPFKTFFLPKISFYQSSTGYCKL